jgi:hypothetical protein
MNRASFSMITMWKSATCLCQPVPTSRGLLAFTSCASTCPPVGNAEVAIQEEIAQSLAHPGRVPRLYM